MVRLHQQSQNEEFALHLPLIVIALRKSSNTNQSYANVQELLLSLAGLEYQLVGRQFSRERVALKVLLSSTESRHEFDSCAHQY